MASTQQSKPLDDLTYDIVSILHEKSQALQAYDAYLEDAQQEPDVARLLEEIRRHDEEDVQKLRSELGRLLASGAEQGVAETGQDVGTPV